jgi:hypothetical protein
MEKLAPRWLGSALRLLNTIFRTFAVVVDRHHQRLPEYRRERECLSVTDAWRKPTLPVMTEA